MKKILIISLLSMVASLQASTIHDDNLKLGDAKSSSAKSITFDTGDGSSNKKLELDPATKDLKTNVNTLQVGDGTTSSKKIIFDSGAGSSNAYIGWDETLGAPVFSKDGVLAKKLGSGEGGGAAGITFNENGGLEDGISQKHSFTEGVATELGASNALIGEKSVRLDFAAENDYFRSDYFILPKGLYGNACELRFKYKGGDENIYVKVETEGGAVLGQYQRPEAGAIVYGLQALTSPGYDSVYFKCPTEADITSEPLHAKIRYVFFQGTSIDAAPMDVDAITQGELVGLVETTTPDILSAIVSSTGVVSSNGDGLISSCSIPTTGTTTCQFNSGVFTVPPTCVASPVTHANEFTLTAVSTSTFTVLGKSSSGAAITTSFQVFCKKNGVDAKQTAQVYKSIPKVSENINDFGFDFIYSSGVTRSLLPIVCSKTSVGIYSCDTSALNLTAQPICTATIRGSTGDMTAQITNSSVSNITVHINASTSSSYFDALVSVLCQKDKDDFKLPTVQPIAIGQVTNSVAESAIKNVRVETCAIANSGSASISGVNGMCSSWVNSVSRGAAGVVTVHFKEGIWSSRPNCQCNVVVNNGICNFSATPTTTNGTIYSYHASGSSASDRDLVITCVGER